MTDLLARLRAVNPVSTCAPPTVEDVWRKLEHEDQIPGLNAPRPESPDLKRRRGGMGGLSRVRLRHIGLGLAVAVPVLVAALAIVLLGHNQSASPTRPAHPEPAIAPSHTGASSSIDAALARGIRPPAPDANMALPILGSSATRSIASFRGKVVVLNVFASWCQLCKTQTATLEQAQAVIAGQGATVLGVTYEDHSAASAAFVRATHITYPVLRDPSGRFVRSFGVLRAVPETIIIDRRGRIAAARAGQIDDRWLTQTLGRLFPVEHLIPAGLPLKSPPTASQLAAIANAYPLLGRRQQPTDVPPHGVLDPYVVSQGGLVANSRRALVTPRGESLYIVPAHKSICVSSSDGVVQGCQPFPFTATTPADIGATICAPNLPPTELEVAGLMPPGASDIKAHYSNGSSQPLTATNGTIAIYAPFKGPLPMSITWISPQGPQRTGTAVPPNAASSKCAS
jgi:cytochrome c biogenesis protein CcmG/thiol:disulfide interchange protein DsbE